MEGLFKYCDVNYILYNMNSDDVNYTIYYTL